MTAAQSSRIARAARYLAVQRKQVADAYLWAIGTGLGGFVLRTRIDYSWGEHGVLYRGGFNQLPDEQVVFRGDLAGGAS